MDFRIKVLRELPMDCNVMTPFEKKTGSHYLWNRELDIHILTPQWLVLKRLHCILCCPYVIIRYHNKTTMLASGIECPYVPILLKKAGERNQKLRNLWTLLKPFTLRMTK